MNIFLTANYKAWNIISSCFFKEGLSPVNYLTVTFLFFLPIPSTNVPAPNNPAPVIIINYIKDSAFESE